MANIGKLKNSPAKKKAAVKKAPAVKKPPAAKNKDLEPGTIGSSDGISVDCAAYETE